MASIHVNPDDTAFQDYCPQRRRRFVLIAAILASAMGFIDGTVVSIAIPSIRASLDATLTDAQWINNAYMLALSALILVGGAAGDKYGLRRLFSVGIALFVVASIACALAPGPGFLIGARAFQGIGAAIMVPGSLAIISKTYPQEDRARAIGIWAASSALTTAIGPVLGGALLSTGQADIWRLIFAINLPVGAIALYLLLARVPDDTPVSDVPLDRWGAVFATLSLGLIAWALTGPEGEEGLAGAGHVLLYGLPGVLLFAVFLRWERRADHPMMPLRLFAVGEFSAANAVTFLLYFALSAVLFYLPMALITGWDLPEIQVSMLFLPITVAIAAGIEPDGPIDEPHRPGAVDRRRLRPGGGGLRLTGLRVPLGEFLGPRASLHVPYGDRHDDGGHATVGERHGLGTVRRCRRRVRHQQRRQPCRRSRRRCRHGRRRLRRLSLCRRPGRFRPAAGSGSFIASGSVGPGFRNGRLDHGRIVRRFELDRVCLSAAEGRGRSGLTALRLHPSPGGSRRGCAPYPIAWSPRNLR